MKADGMLALILFCLGSAGLSGHRKTPGSLSTKKIGKLTSCQAVEP